jgi:hypothetical protein
MAADKAKAKAKSDAPVLAGAPTRVVVGIKVKFELNAKNGLRRVVFGLEKDTDGDDVQWKIEFELYERLKKSEPYDDPLVSLDCELDTKLNAKAEKAAHDGLTSTQAAHALGPAADDAKEADPGDAKETIAATLKK